MNLKSWSCSSPYARYINLLKVLRVGTYVCAESYHQLNWLTWYSTKSGNGVHHRLLLPFARHKSRVTPCLGTKAPTALVTRLLVSAPWPNSSLCNSYPYSQNMSPIVSGQHSISCFWLKSLIRHGSVCTYWMSAAFLILASFRWRQRDIFSGQKSHLLSSEDQG